MNFIDKRYFLFLNFTSCFIKLDTLYFNIQKIQYCSNCIREVSALYHIFVVNTAFLTLSHVCPRWGGEGVDNFAERVRDRWTKSICRRPLTVLQISIIRHGTVNL